MRCVSEDKLANFYPLLPTEKVRLVRRLAKARDDAEKLEELIRKHCPKTTAHANQCHSSPFHSHMWRTTMALEAIDETVGGFGIEPLGPIKMREGPPYEYVNTGDPYYSTLIYKRDTDNLFIGCWGDIAERHPNW